MENEIKDFWQTHPCGADLVGDLTDESRATYLDFFQRYDDHRYSTESHILSNLDRIDFDVLVDEIFGTENADDAEFRRDGDGPDTTVMIDVHAPALTDDGRR